MLVSKINLKTFFITLIISSASFAQFTDHFNKDKIEGWFFFTGDGNAEMNFIQKDGYARILVDATKDKYNVWWAIIKRDVSSYLDLNKFKDTLYQLRVEAKVRVSSAPKRLNFMVNTNRTTNFHIDLMEYDIPDTSNWHVISMTTKKFDALPGDTVYVQLDVTDWGTGKYYVDVDYYKADIVNIKSAGPDKGELVPYHPPVPGINSFSNHLQVSDNALINLEFPDVNFNDWHINKEKQTVKILTINPGQWGILKWNFEEYKNSETAGSAILELTSYNVFAGGRYSEIFGEDLGMEFGKVRVIEILEGDPAWQQDKITYNALTQGKDYDEIFNTQMIYDFEPSTEPGSRNFITISKPVMQRLLDGRTKGLLLRTLGAVDASFYAAENQNEFAPRIHFNLVK